VRAVLDDEDIYATEKVDELREALAGDPAPEADPGRVFPDDIMYVMSETEVVTVRGLQRDLTAANARIAELEEECDAYQMQRDAANARAEAAERGRADTVEALKQKTAELNDMTRQALVEAEHAIRSESEAAALRAEVARLNEREHAWSVDVAHRHHAESRLAAANALLSELAEDGGGLSFAPEMLRRAVLAHLAACAAPAKDRGSK
jgi:hypothetical protein